MEPTMNFRNPDDNAPMTVQQPSCPLQGTPDSETMSQCIYKGVQQASKRQSAEAVQLLDEMSDAEAIRFDESS